MKVKKYSCKCPIHDILMYTDKTINITIENSVNSYVKPKFYCNKCQAFYVFIDEFKSDFLRKSKSEPYGLPIYILGKYDKSRSKSILLSNNTISAVNGKAPRTGGGSITATIVPEGTKLPKKCEYCGADTHDYTCILKMKGQVKKQLKGKICIACEKKYIPESLYRHYSDWIIADNSEISSKTRKIIQKYLLAEDRNDFYDFQKYLIDTKEDIDVELRKKMNGATKKQRDRILLVALKRSPQNFLLDAWQQYSTDQLSFTRLIKELDFKNKDLRHASIDLIKVISPYPSSLLSKLSGDKKVQKLIGEEIKKGIINQDYLKFISSNRELLSDIEIQKVIQNHFVDLETDWNYLPYIDLNDVYMISFLKPILDFTVIYYILQNNILGIEENSYRNLPVRYEIVKKIQNRNQLDEYSLEDIQNYINSVIDNPDIIQDSMIIDDEYINILFTFANSIENTEVLENLYTTLDSIGYNLKAYDNLLAERSSEILFDKWITNLNNSTNADRIKIVKQILQIYPDKISYLASEIEKSNDRNYVAKVKKVVASMHLIWPSIKIADAEAEDLPESNDKKESKIIIMDDFGKEFDFSALRDFLIL